MSRRVRTVLLGAVLLTALTAPAAHAAPEVPADDRAVVGVSVATVWTSPASPRERDRTATGAPADPAGWLSSMSVADRRELTTSSRTQTQVLYGASVRVLERRPGWTRVAVPGQPSAKDDRGYPGWIPSAQLTGGDGFAGLAAALPTGTVDGVATTWLHTDRARTDRLLEVSAGTRLPVLAGDAQGVQLALPDGGTAWIDPRHVRIGAERSAGGTSIGAERSAGGTSIDTERSAGGTGRGAAAAPEGKDLVATAGLFLDRPYLWGGRSGFGLDCSGLTGLVYELHGVTLGRDASDQARGGRPVAADALRPGDLLFWGSPATHVALYAGDGRMIEAFDAASPVRVAPVREFDSARRYLPDPR